MPARLAPQSRPARPSRRAESKTAVTPKPLALEIVAARHGTTAHWVDVTDKIRQLARETSLVCTADLFTIQLPEGVRPVLSIDYRLGEQKMSAEFGFTEFVSLGAAMSPRNLPSKGLVIAEAGYGCGLAWVDELGLLNKKTADGHLEGVVHSDWLGLTDPAPYHPKVLYVRYWLDGKEHIDCFKEGQRISIGNGK